MSSHFERGPVLCSMNRLLADLASGLALALVGAAIGIRFAAVAELSQRAHAACAAGCVITLTL